MVYSLPTLYMLNKTLDIYWCALINIYHEEILWNNYLSSISIYTYVIVNLLGHTMKQHQLQYQQKTVQQKALFELLCADHNALHN